MITFFSIASVVLILLIIGIIAHFFVQKDQRRKKLVDFRLQLQIAVETVLQSLLLLISIGVIVYVPPFVEWLSNAPGQIPDEKILYHQEVVKNLLLFNWTKWPMFILILALIGVLSIIFSHHLIGPLVKLRSHLKQLLSKDFSRELRFRKGDIHIFLEIQNQFNQLTGDFRSSLEAIREEADALRKAKQDPDEIEERASKIQEIIGKYGVGGTVSGTPDQGIPVSAQKR
jgi:methyl-accepting chemotaxis protein